MHRNNTFNLKITKHAIQRLFQAYKFPGLAAACDEEKERWAKNFIHHMFEDAVYVRIEDGAVIFRAVDYKANMVVRNHTIVTIIHDERCKKNFKPSKAI